MTETRNEAADRLLRHWIIERSPDDIPLAWLNDALAAERRATVERIRDRWHSAEHFDDLWDILDEEAAR